jgi:hypothetical protein
MLKPHTLTSSQFKKSNKMEFPYEEPQSYIIQPRDLYDHGPNSMIEMELNLLAAKYHEDNTLFSADHISVMQESHRYLERLYQTVEMIRDYSWRLFESIIPPLLATEHPYLDFIW